MCLFTALMSFGFDLASIGETMVYSLFYPLFNKYSGVFSRRYSELILLGTQLANILIFPKEEEHNLSYQPVKFPVSVTELI